MDHHTNDAEQFTSPLAVSYLRVSTKAQAHRGGRDEGYSLPDQRKVVDRKAANLSAVIVAEFIDPGESAKTRDKRTSLNEMMEYIRANTITYCIIPKLDRLARNRLDDALIHAELRAEGVKLVSAAENIDETPAGMLTHGIMASIAEFYSLNLAMEVTKGLRTKATTGGTIGRAPLGYRNIQVRTDNGYELRTVELDPERAPLVTWAFEAYATGDWTLSTLLEELTLRGLTSVASPRRPSKPIFVSTLHRMLQNPYYKGTVIYDGVPYDGTHQPLVPVDVWTQVQAVLRANNVAGDKTQTHDHYLKGSVYCSNCGSRLVITHAKNRHGSIYPYFICAGRHRKTTDCTRKAMHIYQVEDLIVQHYSRVQLDPATRTALEGAIAEEFAILGAQATLETQDLTKQKHDLLIQRDKLMQAHYAGAVPLDQLKAEQDRISSTLAQITGRLDAASANYAEAQAELADCLDLTSDCYAVYQQAPDSVRRLFNQAFFEKIYITDQDEIRAVPTGAFALLLDTSTQTAARHRHDTRPRNAQTPDRSSADEGLNLMRWVELEGFEPSTSSMPWKRATNCAIAPNRTAALSCGDPSTIPGPRRADKINGCAGAHCSTEIPPALGLPDVVSPTDDILDGTNVVGDHPPFVVPSIAGQLRPMTVVQPPQCSEGPGVQPDHRNEAPRDRGTMGGNQQRLVCPSLQDMVEQSLPDPLPHGPRRLDTDLRSLLACEPPRVRLGEDLLDLGARVSLKIAVAPFDQPIIRLDLDPATPVKCRPDQQATLGQRLGDDPAGLVGTPER